MINSESKTLTQVIEELLVKHDEDLKKFQPKLAKYKSVAQVATEHGFPPVTPEQQQKNFDENTEDWTIY